MDFIDRECYTDLVESSYKEILRNYTALKIIFFYGAGGFGKTALIEKIVTRMKPIKPLHITLEITDKDDKLDILIKFRKKLPKKKFYPLFDFAVQYLWNNLNTAQLDTEFLDLTQRSLWQYIKSGADIFTTAVFPSIDIATGSVADLVGEAYTKLKKIYFRHRVSAVLDEIATMHPHVLIARLPELLGIDIHKAFLNEKLVFIIDSYQQYSKHLIDPTSWLTTLIENIGYGLFIITSREQINWPDNLRKFVSVKKLDELPETDVRDALMQKYNPDRRLLENIISVTRCVPIYLDLAVKSLDAAGWKSFSCDPCYFKNREDIVRQFLAHLPDNEQEAITILAIVRIFNEEIFEFLVKDLNLSVNVTKFEDICQRTLVRNIEYDHYFYKTHDVISENISKLTSSKVIQRILSSYITIIRSRVIYNCTNTQTSMLFKHIIFLIIANKLSISELDTEKILDIYFMIKESLLPFNCDDIDTFHSYEPLSNLYSFLKVLSEERNDSSVRLTMLENIPENNTGFGKHAKSFLLMKGYLKALCQGSQWMKVTVDKINSALSDNDKQEWYYGQTKIFFGDCYISYGQFKTGIDELKSYKKLLTELIGKENDAFQITRHIAHGYRFNMLLDEAEDQYRSLIEGKDVNPTLLQKVYILTNLCETCCYFKPDEVLSIESDANFLAEKFNDLKSKGKICYSLAIAYLHKRSYKLAEKNIADSIKFNQADGYMAGQLYAYMARAYYEYARYGNVSNETENIIKSIQKKIQVYGYFSVPIAMMQERYSDLKKLREEYEWIDFDKTIITYRKFLDLIHNS